MKRNKTPTPTEVIVCVHNSFDDVQACIQSVLDTLRNDDRLIIVDDGSETETQKLCEGFAASNPGNCHLIRRPQGSGFCKAANAGMRYSTADMIVLLNSDTIVSGDWLNRLDACLNSNWKIGLAGPLSNAGGWQSIPFLPGPDARPNEVPSNGEVIGAIHTLCGEFAARFGYPVVEQLNGFCLAISRPVLDAIGMFDEERFPMGYGEESDFVLRAQDAGFLCAVSIDCFVFHSKTKSYTSEQRLKYNDAGQKNLKALHGEHRIRNAVLGTQYHPTLVTIRNETQSSFEQNGWLDAGKGQTA